MPHKESPPGWLSVTEAISWGYPKVKFSKEGKPYFFLEQWRGKVGNIEADRISKLGKEIGTEFHREIEDRFLNPNWLRHADDNIHRMSCLFWSHFVEPFDVKPILLEPKESYKDEKLKLQGSFDGHVQTNKGEYMGDWKTSNQLDRITLGMQIAAYDYLYGKKINKGVGVRIDKKSNKPDIEWFEDLRPYFKAFKKVLAVAKLNRYGLEENNE